MVQRPYVTRYGSIRDLVRTLPHLLLFAGATLSACTDTPSQPSGPRLEGTYRVTTLAFASPDTVFDLLPDVDSLTLTLHADGTTSGSQAILSVPPTDLAGRWDTTAATLHLHIAAPSFLSRISFTIAPAQLLGELPLPPNTLRIALTK